MRVTHTQPVDVIAELRLRQWARANYVPADYRVDTDWHPVVLDEMRRKDTERSVKSSHSNHSSVGVPSRDLGHPGLRVDSANESRPTPHFHGQASTGLAVSIPYYA